MKIVFIGTVEFSRKALEKLISFNSDIAGVFTKKAPGFNADFSDLSEICTKNEILFWQVDNINSKNNVMCIKKLKPDVIFCLGFSQILKKPILNIPKIGVIGYHPSKLPSNRGKHPLIWALVLGLTSTASTYFFMDDGADSGDIISQKEIEITYDDNARSLYDKVVNAALVQLKEILQDLKRGDIKRISQDHAKSNYWRKRTNDDGRIKFTSKSREIYNLVRALTKPYVGAHVLYNGKEIKIWEAKEAEVEKLGEVSGRVLEAKDNKILIKCADKAVVLAKHDFKEFPKIGEIL